MRPLKELQEQKLNDTQFITVAISCQVYPIIKDEFDEFAQNVGHQGVYDLIVEVVNEIMFSTGSLYLSWFEHWANSEGNNYENFDNLFGQSFDLYHMDEATERVRYRLSDEGYGGTIEPQKFFKEVDYTNLKGLEGLVLSGITTKELTTNTVIFLQNSLDLVNRIVDTSKREDGCDSLYIEDLNAHIFIPNGTSLFHFTYVIDLQNNLDWDGSESFNCIEELEHFLYRKLDEQEMRERDIEKRIENMVEIGITQMYLDIHNHFETVSNNKTEDQMRTVDDLKLQLKNELFTYTLQNLANFQVVPS